ncbi:winged helix-turn-helix transcriptional regulator [Plantactinospora sp. GCM10030261]|uniref:winged helix-turn-helix transcriptional regulator n=1 Tax=Plantactinospora sp. GCM10030261 TaxID=3273420 RepID=UPI00362221C6
MARKRRYDDGCAASHALDLVGERWALLVVRELLFGPKRFTDLRMGLPGASPNVLAQRLREMEEAGVTRRRKLPPPAATWVYELTTWGRELEPVITALGRWGVRSPSLRHDAALSSDSLMLALKTMFDPELADGLTIDLGLRMGEDTFRVQLSAGVIQIRRGETDQPDAIVETAPATLNALLWEDRGLDDAIASGDVRLSGSHERVERFLRLFPSPEPAMQRKRP